jgi:hypothetical protein
MIQISINEPLNRYCRNETSCTADGKSVLEVLKGVCNKYPDLKKKLFKSENCLTSQVLIYKNRKDIRLLQNEQTPVEADTKLKLVVALCGG